MSPIEIAELERLVKLWGRVDIGNATLATFVSDHHAALVAGLRGNEWQPIETAPKDYDKHGLTPRIMLAAPPVNASGWMIAEGFWRVAASDARHRTGWVTCMDPNVEDPYFYPTHWRPLPNPPNLTQPAEPEEKTNG